MENALGARISGRWWRAIAASLVFTGSACVAEGPAEVEDPEDEPAIVAGAADGSGLAEGTALAASLLRFVNGAPIEALTAQDGPWLSARTARRIVDQRAGDDRIEGTIDDDPFNSLAELDAVPYVGRSVFSRLEEQAEAQPLDDVACEATSDRASPLELVVAPGPLEERILALVAGASRSIDVTIYQFTSESVRAALGEAASRGVHVRVILDRTQEENVDLVGELEAAGVEARLSSESFVYTHQKTITVDEELTLVSSGNLETRSFATSRNYSVIDRDFEDVRDFDAIFEADWNGVAPRIDCTRLVYSPVNSRARVLELIQDATTTIDVEAMYITDSGVFDALVAAQRRGVRVRAILNDPRFGITSSSRGVSALRAAGAEVRRLPSLFVHAKVMYVDDAWFFVGSENFSSNSLNRNREAGVILGRDAFDAGLLRETLDADWSESVAY
jgi:cardiolipin synthase